MGVYQKNGKWWVDYYHTGCRIRKPVSASKTKAREILNKINIDILMNKYALPNDQKITFAEFIKKYIKEHSIPNKKDYSMDISRSKVLVEFFGDYCLNEITDYHAQQYRIDRSKQKAYKKKSNVAPTTINRELALLRHVLNTAVSWGFLSHNPIKKLPMAKEQTKEKILTMEEINRLVHTAQEPLKSIVLVALNTGMRLREILNLKWDRINLDQKFITLQAEEVKSHKIRRIPLNSPMMELLPRLKLKRSGSIYVYPNPDTGKPFHSLRRAFQRACQRANIDGLRFHDLRHNFATYTLLKGGDLISLKETLGHADITTTSRYTKAMMEGQRKLVSGFEIGDKTGEVIDFTKYKTGTQ